MSNDTGGRRFAPILLALSAAGLVSIAEQEGYTDKAVIPVKGDKPTLGFGTTEGVKPDDTTTPPKALVRALAHIQKDERGIKACVTAPLTQGEYDIMVDFSYQYGVPTLCRSSIVREANAGRYAQSCEAYKAFRMVPAARGEQAGPGFVMGKDGVLRYDCSTLVNGKPNKRCWGVWSRSQDRHTKCMAEQG